MSIGLLVVVVLVMAVSLIFVIRALMAPTPRFGSPASDRTMRGWSRRDGRAEGRGTVGDGNGSGDMTTGIAAGMLFNSMGDGADGSHGHREGRGHGGGHHHRGGDQHEGGAGGAFDVEIDNRGTDHGSGHGFGHGHGHSDHSSDHGGYDSGGHDGGGDFGGGGDSGGGGDGGGGDGGGGGGGD